MQIVIKVDSLGILDRYVCYESGIINYIYLHVIGWRMYPTTVRCGDQNQ